MSFARALFAVLCVLLPLAAKVQAQTISDFQPESTGAIDRFVAEGAHQQALALAERAVQEAKRAPADMARQADAFDLLAYAYSAIALHDPLVALKSGQWQYGKKPAEARGTAISENLKKADRAVDAALGIRRRPPLQPERLIATLLQAAVIKRGQDARAGDAPKLLDECLEIARKAYGTSDARLAALLTLIANAHEMPFFQKRLVIDHLAEAIDIKRRAKDAFGSDEIANDYEQLGALLRDTGARGDALALWSQAIEIRNANVRASPSDNTRLALLYVLSLHGHASLSLGDLEGVSKDLKAMSGLKVQSPLARHRHAFFTRRLQADLTAYRGNRQEAIAVLTSLLADVERTAAIEEDPDSERISLLTRLAAVLAEESRFDEAARDLKQARALLLHTPGIDSDRPQRVAGLDLALADIERRRGNPNADRLFQSVATMQKELTGEMPIFFGTNRAKVPGAEAAAFGAGSSGNLTLGTSLVMVPGGAFSSAEKVAAAEELPEDFTAATNAEGLAIRRKMVVTAEEFANGLRQRLQSAKTARNAILVFVHGYHVTFDYALLRAGQLARDLAFDGPVVVFSWPSEGRLLAYKNDQAVARKSPAALANFLTTVLRSSENATIHIVAHSMGNEVFLPALQALLDANTPEYGKRLGELVFAAPDVDTNAFRQAVEKLAGSGHQQQTLYASGNDKALIASLAFNGGSLRAGFVPPMGMPLVIPAIDTVELTAAGGDFMSHDTFARNPIIMADLRRLLIDRTRPPDRRAKTLEMIATPSGPYWKYMRAPSLQQLISGN